MRRVYESVRRLYNNVIRHGRLKSPPPVQLYVPNGYVYDGVPLSFPNEFWRAVSQIRSGRSVPSNDPNIVFRSCAGWVFLRRDSGEDL